MSYTNDKWMSYEEYAAQQRYFRLYEARVLIKAGLGWIVKFCSK